MQDGVVAHVHGDLAALFHDTAVCHIAAGGEASAEVEDIADLHVLEVIGGNGGHEDLFAVSVFNHCSFLLFSDQSTQPEWLVMV